eukprot:102303-Rhodomonas_salina.1
MVLHDADHINCWVAGGGVCGVSSTGEHKGFASARRSDSVRGHSAGIGAVFGVDSTGAVFFNTAVPGSACSDAANRSALAPSSSSFKLRQGPPHPRDKEKDEEEGVHLLQTGGEGGGKGGDAGGACREMRHGCGGSVVTCGVRAVLSVTCGLPRGGAEESSRAATSSTPCAPPPLPLLSPSSPPPLPLLPLSLLSSLHTDKGAEMWLDRWTGCRCTGRR